MITSPCLLYHDLLLLSPCVRVCYRLVTRLHPPSFFVAAPRQAVLYIDHLLRVRTIISHLVLVLVPLPSQKKRQQQQHGQKVDFSKTLSLPTRSKSEEKEEEKVYEQKMGR